MNKLQHNIDLGGALRKMQHKYSVTFDKKRCFVVTAVDEIDAREKGKALLRGNWKVCEIYKVEG